MVVYLHRLGPGTRKRLLNCSKLLAFDCSSAEAPWMLLLAELFRLLHTTAQLDVSLNSRCKAAAMAIAQSLLVSFHCRKNCSRQAACRPCYLCLSPKGDKMDVWHDTNVLHFTTPKDMGGREI